MSNETDLHHNFPSAVDQFVDVNSGHSFTGGDGTTYNFIILPGSVNNTSGFFEYIIGPNGMCNHRFFRKAK